MVIVGGMERFWNVDNRDIWSSKGWWKMGWIENEKHRLYEQTFQTKTYIYIQLVFSNFSLHFCTPGFYLVVCCNELSRYLALLNYCLLMFQLSKFNNSELE